MQNQPIIACKSVINGALSYDEKWAVVTVVNTQGLIFGHTAIVVEFLEKDENLLFVKPFIGHYDIVADESAFRELHENNDSSLIRKLNKKGYITEIRCSENEHNQRPYKEKNWPHYSWRVPVSNAKKMIMSIKRDAINTKKAYENYLQISRYEKPIHLKEDGSPYELFLFQRLGNTHPLVKFLGDTNAGNNCAGYCNDKLSEHLGILIEISKPKKSAHQCSLF